MILEHERSQSRLMGFGRQREGLDLEFAERQERRHSWFDDAVFVGTTVISADVQNGRGVEVAIERPRQTVLFEINFAGELVGTDLIRLEERAEAVVVDLSERVVFVVVALRAAFRCSQCRR